MVNKLVIKKLDYTILKLTFVIGFTENYFYSSFRAFKATL